MGEKGLRRSRACLFRRRDLLPLLDLLLSLLKLLFLFPLSILPLFLSFSLQLGLAVQAIEDFAVFRPFLLLRDQEVSLDRLR